MVAFVLSILHRRPSTLAMAAVSATEWRTLHTSRASWRKHALVCMAKFVIDELPEGVVNLLLTEQLKGGPLTVMKDDRTTHTSLKANAIWILPFIKKTQDRVPSPFYIADVLAEMDRQLQGKLLRPAPGKGDNKIALAMAEGMRIKRLIGYLRYLWRASPIARDPDIHHLKSFLEKKDGTSEEASNTEGHDDEDCESNAEGNIKDMMGDASEGSMGDTDDWASQSRVARAPLTGVWTMRFL